MKYSSNNNSNNKPQTDGQNRSTERKPRSTQELVQANIQFLIEQLESGHSETLTQYLTAMARFRNYSFGNILMIARQRAQSTHVAGMYAWNQLKRRVKRGEKGIQILAPMLGKKRKDDDDPEGGEGGAAATAEDRKPQAKYLVGFRPVYVWDIAQTEGEPLPELEEVQGEPRQYLARLVTFTMEQGIKFGYSEKIAPARGISYKGAIQLMPDLTEAEQFSTLVHELAHELLHQSERRTMTTKRVRETEAEAIAFVVTKAIGLDSGNASSDYIQLYHGNAKLLQESLEVVQQTSAVILGAISPEVSKTASTTAA